MVENICNFVLIEHHEIRLVEGIQNELLSKGWNCTIRYKCNFKSTNSLDKFGHSCSKCDVCQFKLSWQM